MTTNPVFGLVLAGGKSRRMGSDKALLRRAGMSQLDYVTELLSSVVDEVFVSARQDQADDPERSRYALVLDDYDDIGPLAGILSALEQYPNTDWLVLACDLPNVEQETLEYLLRKHDTRRPFTAFRSTHDDLPEPLCAIYNAGSEVVLHEYVDDGIVCPRKILIRSDTCLLEQPNPRALENVNTPAELEQSILENVS